MKMQITDKDAIEELIDAYGLESVLNAIGDICAEKAEHIRSNWQDSVTARPWHLIAARLWRETARAHSFSPAR